MLKVIREQIVRILDDIDTYLDNVSNDIAPFKAVFNDQYAKDTSKKVKRTLKNIYCQIV